MVPNMWYQHSFFKYAFQILLILLILFLLVKLLPFFYPLLDFIRIFFSPLIMGVVLYYIFRPLFNKMVKYHAPVPLALAVIFLFLAAVIGTLVTFVAPLVLNPIQEVAAAPSEKIEEVKEATLGFLNIFNFNLYSYNEIKALVIEYISKFQQTVLKNTFNILSTITHVAFLFVITPFALFYLLKDDHKFYSWVIEAVPTTYRNQAEKILENLDQTLSIFFSGQIMIALCVTGMAFCGLLAIGIDNLAFLTFVTFLFSLIPYLGTFIAIIPPVLAGLASSYLMALAAAVVMVAVHLIEANLITPNVMMKQFDIHPLTVILLVVASFSFFGITGPLWITPVYVFLREVVMEAYALIYAYEFTGKNEK